LGLFESKVAYFTLYWCYWGPLWKRSEPTYTLHVLLWSFESRVLAQCSCCWAPL